MSLSMLLQQIGDSSGSDGPASSSGKEVPDGRPQPAPPLAVENRILSNEELLKLEAVRSRHRLTHLPKNRFCAACNQCKVYQKHARRRDADVVDAPLAFGDLITGDHLITNDVTDQGLNGESGGLALLDRGTKYFDLIPVDSKSSEDAAAAMRDFAGRAEVKSFI